MQFCRLIVPRGNNYVGGKCGGNDDGGGGGGGGMETQAPTYPAALADI